MPLAPSPATVPRLLNPLLLQPEGMGVNAAPVSPTNCTGRDGAVSPAIFTSARRTEPQR